MNTPPHAQDDDAPRSPLLNLLIMVTLATVVVACWYLLDYYLRDSQDDVTWYPPSGDCELRDEPCEASLGLGAQMVFGVGSDLSPTMTLPLTVALQGVEANAVTVEFVGRNMPMGLHRFPLKKVGPGTFVGEGQIDRCSEAVMPWRAQVVVETDKARRGSWFDFEVVRRH
ncbi:hypothetical protein [Onishia niordana]|uniref:hypothetical protein n=1 Tax=Onishia niordana TaxID=2508711 RepID=UPI0010A03BE1|nr:hypothetical protein [Halomonas niordiana]